MKYPSKGKIFSGLILGSALVLTGCETIVVEVGVKQPQPGNCTAGPEVSQEICRNNGSSVDVDFGVPVTGQEAVSIVNFNDFSIILDGTTVTFPTSGTFTLTLKNSSSQVVAASSFGWLKQGNSLIASSPSSVQNWVAAANSTFSNLEVGIDSTDVIVDQGINAIMITPKMGQTILGSAASVWTQSYCPTDPLSQVQLCL